MFGKSHFGHMLNSNIIFCSMQVVLEDLPDLAMKLNDLTSASEDISRVCNEPQYMEQASHLEETVQDLKEAAAGRKLDLEKAAKDWQNYDAEIQNLTRTIAGCKRAILSPDMEKKTLHEQLEMQKVCTIKALLDM